MSIASNPAHVMNIPCHAPNTQGEHRPVALACMHSADLLRGQKTVEILHNGSTYRLQATRLGKLILTK